MRDLSHFYCPNKSCADYQKRDNGNLKVRQTYGKTDSIRLLECRTCGTRFSERTNTVLFGRSLPRTTLISVLHHLAEGDGTRKTARLTGVHRDTVTDLTRQVGLQAKQIHDELVRDVPVEEAQVDEKWSFVEKKTGQLHP